MKNILKYIALAPVFSLAVSCNGYLDTVPDNRTEIDNVEKLAKLVGSSYPDGNYAVMFNARVDNVSDKGAGSYTQNQVNIDSFFWRDVNATGQDSPDYFWSHAYQAIAHSNHAIEAAEKINSAESEPFLAEAKLTRALSHFILVTSFAKFWDPYGKNDSPGVPYVTKPETVVTAQYDRSTVGKVWELVEEDMLEGIKNLGSDSKYSIPRYHFNIAAANAFAARYYLYKGEWDKVVSYASNVIPVPSVFTAEKNVATGDAATIYAQNNFQPWNTTYREYSSSNQIKVDYTKASTASNLLLVEMSSWLARNANTYKYATREVDCVNTVNAINVTGGTWSYAQYHSGTENYYIPKFREHFVYTSIGSSSGYGYTMMPMFRNEEVLLSRAEAYVHMDMLDNAIADLNVFCRQRIKDYNEVSHNVTLDKIVNFYQAAVTAENNYLTTYNAYNTASWSPEKKAVLMFVLDCRRNELMWEGLRYWDMIRYKIPITHSTKDGDTNTLYPGDDRWVLQIPETAELSGLELNPRTNLLSKEW